VASLQTRDCILLRSADVDLWSNSVDWCGSNFTIRTPLLTNAMWAWTRYCGAGHPGSSLPPLPSSSAWGGSMLLGQSIDQAIRVLEGEAAPCRRQAVYPCLLNDLPGDNYRRSALFAWDHSCMISCDLSAPRYCKVDESAINIVISRDRYEPYYYW